jgi:hypothetical protein
MIWECNILVLLIRFAIIFHNLFLWKMLQII